MLEMISKGFKNARLKLKGKSELTEDNIKAAVKDVRISLLEADVEIPVVRTFTTVKTCCIGEVVMTTTDKSEKKRRSSRRITSSRRSRRVRQPHGTC